MARIRRDVFALALLFLFLGGAHLAAAQEAGKININTASVEELMTLRGIGEVIAKAIVAYREQNGPFKTVDDLVAVRGIGEKTLSSLRDKITVGSPPPAAHSKPKPSS